MTPALLGQYVDGLSAVAARMAADAAVHAAVHITRRLVVVWAARRYEEAVRGRSRGHERRAAHSVMVMVVFWTQLSQLPRFSLGVCARGLSQSCDLEHLPPSCDLPRSTPSQTIYPE